MALRKLLPNQELFIVDFGALRYLDNFLISAVVAIVTIRSYLFLTGYPQIGSDTLHIAHMLWGGLLMMVTVVGLLAFINKQAKLWASIIGGIGFGIFIDELGKFITKDNDYFFQPTIALVYLLFLIIYFSFRKLFHVIEKDEKEYIMNALELLKEAVFYDLDTAEKRKLTAYLRQADEQHPLTAEIEQLVSKLEAIPVRSNGRLLAIRKRFSGTYHRLVKGKNFIVMMMLATGITIAAQMYLAIANLRTLFPIITIWELGLVISVTISVTFSVWGLMKIWEKNILLGFMYIMRSSMIAILFVQFFAFYFHQLLALLPLIAASITYLGAQSVLVEVQTSASRTGRTT